MGRLKATGLMNRLRWKNWLFWSLILAVYPASAQNANFGTLTLTSDRAIGSISGTTGGSTSLPAIVSSTDLHSNPCLGFGDPTPDHILVLQNNFPKLKLQVSGGPDTTLVVQGSDGSVRCGDNIGSRRDANMVDTNWSAGSYRVWVGTATPGVRRNYTLTVRQIK
jgi:pectate lyase